jgi:hypothetical protein
MQNEPIKHDTNYPIAASAGPDNAYYLRHCAMIERGPAYTACLSRLKDIDDGRANERTAQCEKAVRENRCVAHGMREQEQLAGAALFYFPRTNKPFLPANVAGDFGVLITNLTDPALIPKPIKPFGEKPAARPAPSKVDDELRVDALAAAITNAAAKEAEPAAPITQEQLRQELIKNPIKVDLPPMLPPGTGSTVPKIQPGETPLQFARRMAELRKAKQ